MLVHKFYLVECIGVEFKFELNSNRIELFEKETKGRKQESRSVIPSFLSHSRSFLSHSFCSQSFPQPDPTCRPLLSPLSSPAQLLPEIPGEPLSLGPHAKAAPPPYKRNFLSPQNPNPSPATPKISSTAAPFFPRSGRLGLPVVRPLRRAPGHHITRSSSASPPGSFPKFLPSTLSSGRAGIEPEAAAGEALRPRNSSPSVIPGPP
jgi:hypothetical protein